ncbi:CoxG family protein [Variovorax saccharolyticus]|uniref:CoxG family protein n=1 Tax=Variovorax saccharolyticus TaxID=3053516 RepID=UPI00257520FC|nr:carbon monoxide dehydrogenase subunit G [Variovorax sp. J22R187]MDM0022204.1 carbon monoxide dehydrogenase subunit G [Variovorax sp. J22R187]
MEMSSTCSIPASVEVTWRSLNDPLFLKECIAGCEAIDRDGDNSFKVTLAAKIGPVSARFAGRMKMEDLDPPNAYTLIFEGQGGAAGFAKGRARVSLAPEAVNTTSMSYQVSAQVGGKLAQIGSRLVDSAARKVANDFFVAFIAKLASQQTPSTDVAEPVTDSAIPRSGGMKQGLLLGSSYARWTLAAAIVVGAGIAWFARNA